MSRFICRLTTTVASATLVLTLASLPALGADCRRHCSDPEVGFDNGALTASYVASNAGSGWSASNSAPVEHPYTYRLIDPCVANDATTGSCNGQDFRGCPSPPDRVIDFLLIQERRLVLSDGTAADNFPVDPGLVPGTQVGDWVNVARGCVDITALNPPPSPAEVYRYFQTLPLPDLPTQQQPPGNALAGLPVVFYTDGPTTQTFTVDIRGFTVDIVATASAFTWDTGDGTVLQTTDPGAPYPDHTISHDYRSGTYTASLTTTWSGTFSVDGGATADVPGTTTTDGPPATFTVLQASPVLTNPFD
jgi:hypothetical protein